MIESLLTNILVPVAKACTYGEYSSATVKFRDRISRDRRDNGHKPMYGSPNNYRLKASSAHIMRALHGGVDHLLCLLEFLRQLRDLLPGLASHLNRQDSEEIRLGAELDLFFPTSKQMITRGRNGPAER